MSEQNGLLFCALEIGVKAASLIGPCTKCDKSNMKNAGFKKIFQHDETTVD
jgi:hypothetical protein